MASLANQTISSTYDGLIKTSSDNAVPVSGVQALEDGSGNALALSVGRSGNGVTVTGSLNATLATAAQPNITSVGTLTGLTTSGDIDIEVTGSNAFLTVNRTDASTAGALNIRSNNGNNQIESLGAKDLLISTNGSERMRIDSSGYLRLAGAGIQFNGDTAAANALNDYEEGTWSPVFEPQTGSFTTMTMDVLDATYTKIGRLVQINVNLRTDDVDVTGASGNVYIGGLPFTAKNSSGNGGGISIGYTAAFVTAPTAGGFVNNGTQILLRKGTNPLTVADLTDGTTADRNTIYFSATYITS